MKAILSGLIAGVVFGCGLILSEMVNPMRVRGFLDVAGRWDPTLVFVMGGALGVAGLGYQLLFRLPRPVWASEFSLPTARHLDAKLIVGGALFGVGWGLSGLCPGPAIVSAATLNPDILIFVVAMALGMKGFEWFERSVK